MTEEVTKRDAAKTLEAFESGYINDPNDPGLREAARMLNKSVSRVSVPSISQPQMKLVINRVGTRKEESRASQPSREEFALYR